MREAAPDALILVDAISALGAVPFAMDAWGLDLVVTGSQKAWMAAPGMAFAAVGPRAWAAAETARMPRFYLDLKRHRDTQVNGESPWTPAVAVMYQVDEGLRLMDGRGRRRVRPSRRLRRDDPRRASARSASSCSPPTPSRSRTVTAAWIPDGLDWKAFNGGLKRRGLVLAGGQGKLKGRIFRLGHLGSVTTDDILAAIGVLEATAIECGMDVVPGRRRRGRPAGAARGAGGLTR